VNDTEAMTTTPNTPKGECPGCHRVVPLRADGRVGRHASALLSWLDCGGEGYLPEKAVR
jgi:hypothetical protein